MGTTTAQQPGLVRRLAKQIFDTYVPPHVQARSWAPPTWADLQAGFRKHMHLPGLPVRHWVRTYTLQVRHQHLDRSIRCIRSIDRATD